MLIINSKLSIPPAELDFQSTRSSGPGGQNVNKLETKIILRFDVANSPSLSETQRERLLEKLASRLTTEGVLVIASQEHRTQTANREAAVARFVNLLKEALKPVRPRVATRPTRASKEQRLEVKKQRQQVKQRRAKGNWSSDD